MLGAVLGGVALYSAWKQGEAAEDAASNMNSLNASQLALAKEQWNTYKTDILPLEIEAKELGVDAQRLAQERGEAMHKVYMDYYVPLLEQGPDYDRYTSQAASQVNQSFKSQADQDRMNMTRMGLDPSSGRFQAQDRSRGLTQSAVRAGAVNQATQQAEDVFASRVAGQPVAQQYAPSPSMPQGLNQTYQNQALMQGSLSNQYNANASNTIAAGINLWDRFASTGTTPQPSYNAGAAPSFGTGAAQMSYFENGGLVQPKGAQYAEGGMVTGPSGVDNVPATIDGQAPARLSSGEYVIPKDVVDAKGLEFFDKLVERYDSGAGAGVYRGLSRR